MQVEPRAEPTAVPQSTRRFYQPELDGLRFYAFLGVYAFHTIPSQPEFYRNLHLPLPALCGAVIRSGSAGVDLFFALSAYLITSLLLRERRQTGGIVLHLFYIRRILRIWPLYFAVLALGAVLAHFVTGQHLPSYYVAGYALFVGNWLSAAYGNPHSICAALWTVSIEEQFYLAWPALMKMMEGRGLVIAAVLTFVFATLSQVGTVLAGLSGGYIYYSTASHCDSLALGIFLAQYAHRLPDLSGPSRWLLVGSGIFSWIFAYAFLLEQPGPASMRAVFGRLMVSLASGVILWGCLSSRSLLLRGRWVVELGKRSYGLYALHLTGLLIVLSLFHPPSGVKLLATKAVGLIVTILLGFASYRWIESPFLRLKDHFATVLSRPV
jgi:peptidoglycan/LPS O-acetylase OafA/YrhL